MIGPGPASLTDVDRKLKYASRCCSTASKLAEYG